MKIVNLTNNFLDQMAELFRQEYSEPGYEWDIETSKKDLANDLKNYPDFCFAAIDDDGNLLGAIFCRVEPYYKGQALFINSVQVKLEYRKMGVAKSLVKKVTETAKLNGIETVHLLTDERKDFPKNWYLKLSFEPTSWVELETKTDNLLNLLK